MRSILSRAAALMAVLVVAAPAAAGAAVPEYAAEASTSSVKISVLKEAVGSPLLDLVSTDAFAASDPTASASVGIIEVLGEQLFSPVEATSDGASVRDPEEGDGCTLPVDAPGLTLDVVCAVASADAGPSDEATASADTELLDVTVTGSLLAGLLSDPLIGLVASLTDGAEDDAIAQFTAACNTTLDTARDSIPPEVPETVDGILAMSPIDLGQIGTALTDALGPNPCTSLINLTLQDAVPPIINLEAIAGALDGVNLVRLSVDGAKSSVAGADAAMTSTATQALVSVTGPGLDEVDLPGIISGLLSDLEDELIASIEAITGEGTLDALPLDISDEVAGIIGELPEFGTAPLIEATVSGGMATATLDNGDGTTTSGGGAPYVELALAPGVLELLGQDPESGTVRLDSGQSQTIAEGTPLESTISVGALTTEDGAELDGLIGSTATASATTVSLLNVPDAGSVEIALAESNAGVYAASVTAGSAPPPSEPLPHTGGGAAVAAVVALGAGLALRRRRD